jgi:hypothetical protein
MHSDSKNEFWTALFEKVRVNNFLIIVACQFFYIKKTTRNKPRKPFVFVLKLMCLSVKFFMPPDLPQCQNYTTLVVSFMEYLSVLLKLTFCLE